jgi:hypothetical protein
MENFKCILIVFNICLILGLYVLFFVTLFNEKISLESNLLILIIALQLSIKVKLDLKELKDN